MSVTNDTLNLAGVGSPFSKQLSGLEKRQEANILRSDDIGKRQEAISSDTERLAAEKAKAVAPARDALLDKVKDAPSQTVKEEATPEYKRPTLGAEEMHEAFGALMAASMLTGLASRTPYNNVMTAMTGAMNGFMKEDQRLVEESLKTFDKNLASIKEKNLAKRREVDDAWAKYKNDLTGLKTQMELIAAKYDDPLTLAAARSKSLTEMQKIIDSNVRAVDTAVVRLEGIQARADQMHQKSIERKDALEAQRLSPDALRLSAEQYLGGDKSVFTNVGRGAQGGSNLMALRDEISKLAKEKGMTGEQIASKLAEFEGLKSAQRTLGTRTANMGMAVNEASQFADLALEAAGKVPRTDFVPLNKAIELVKSNTASPEQAAFVAANRSFINAYAAAVSRSGGKTVHDTVEAGNMLQTAQGHDAYKATIAQLKKELAAAAKSPEAVREELKDYNRPKRRATDVPQGIPQGSTVIGKTPDGKDVYQSPDGKKWVE